MKRRIRRVLAVLMVITLFISNMGAAASAISNIDNNQLQSSLNKAKTFIDALTINNSSNVPSKVVSTYGTHFTWDNEKKETSNGSIFEWAYYNGVVFEGIEYIYDYLKDSTYRSYVESYMSTMIASDGSWTNTSNNSSKKCAGYQNNNSVDHFKTASILIDMAKDANGNVNKNSKYYKTATTIYNDLVTGTGKNYILSNMGNNYQHKWSSTPAYKVWLDGLYMVQPFLAEYAYYNNNTSLLNTIKGRFQWLYENDRSSGTGLYYHALNSKTDYVNYHWARSIGWLALGMVDCMQYMSGSNLSDMQVYLKDLVDNMIRYQDSSTGMWANLVNKSVTNTNRLETSGSSMMAYAIAKAVNKGWLDSSYAQYAKAAFAGICNNKLSGTNLTDIYFKASGDGNDNYNNASYYYTNEGKGAGPFIMAYAQMLELYDNETSVPEIVEKDLADKNTGVQVLGTTATGITVSDVTNNVKKSGVFENRECVAFDISLAGYTQGEEVTVSIPLPSQIHEDSAEAYYIPSNGVPEFLDSECADGKVTFTTNHMSVYALAEAGDTDEYPVFPNDGSVKIDKWATGDQLRNTGVGEVNLSVTAVPPIYSGGVDVVFVTDVSNSMAWKAGTEIPPINGDSTKIEDMQYAVSNFTDILFANNTGDVKSDNTITFSTFGAWDADLTTTSYSYTDPTRTLVLGSNDANTVKTAVNNITFNSDSDGSSVSKYYLTFNGQKSTNSADTNYGGTNYDVGLYECYNAINNLKTQYYNNTGEQYDSSRRQIYVIFITDGAPTLYNGTQYKSVASNSPVATMQYINPSTGANGSYTGSSYTQATWYNYISTNNHGWATKVFNMNKVAAFNTIGIDFEHGGFKASSETWIFTMDSNYWLGNVLQNLVSGRTTNILIADDQEQLASSLVKEAMSVSSLASSIAKVIDILGADYALQMASTVYEEESGRTISLSDYNITPKITVKKYPTYHKSDVGETVDGVRVTENMIGQHKSETASVIEQITFNADGTEAYSTLISGNIMTDGIIYASTFIYNSTSQEHTTEDGTVIPAKSICWRIGTLSEDELVITYNVYLNGSMQGDRAAGTYDTNENAVLYYLNSRGHECEKEYPVPDLSWEDAGYAYELYLVDANGNPVDRSGNPVSFDNRVEMSELQEILCNLNKLETIDLDELNALLPDGYVLFNEDASFTVFTGSGDTNGFANVNDTTGTTRVYLPDGTVVNPDGTVTAQNYRDMTVAFAIYKISIPSKTVVVDYGKAIKTYPLENDNKGYIIDGLTAQAPVAGMSTSARVTLANGTASYGAEAGPQVPSGNILAEIESGNTKYFFPSTEKTSTSNNTSILRYSVSNNTVTKYQAGSTSGTVVAQLSDGGYAKDGGYAFYCGGDVIYIAKDFTETLVPQKEYVPYDYYQLTGGTTQSTASVSATTSSNRDSILNLPSPDGSVISAYYASQRSGFRTYYYVYIYDSSAASNPVATLTTGTSGSFTHTLKNASDANGNPINITVQISRSSATNATSSRNLTIRYSTFEHRSGTTEIDTSYYTLDLKQEYKYSVTYTPFRYMSSIDRVFYYVTKDGAEATSDITERLYATVTFIPATTVYYEDDFGGSADNGGVYIHYTGDWYTVTDNGIKTEGVIADTSADNIQDRGEVGEGRVPYGYDSSYDGCTKFSNGTATMATGTTVLVNGKPVSNAVAEFTFTGTGFDIISRTDMDCGMITVVINKHDTGAFYTSVPVVNKGTNTLYQIPVISYEGAPYDTYDVKITVNAPSRLLGITGSNFYLDAIRIYNPMGLSSADNADFDESYAAYCTDREANVFTKLIRECLISANMLNVTDSNGAVYVDTLDNDYEQSGSGNIGNVKSPDFTPEEIRTRSIDFERTQNFELIGPNEEVYLSPGSGVGFIVESSVIPESVQLEIKLPVQISGGASLAAQTYGDTSTIRNITVNSATEMYYDITDAVKFVKDGGVYRATVILSNGLESQSESDIVSVTNLKMTYADGMSVNDFSTASADEPQTVFAALKANQETYAQAYDTIYVQHQAITPNFDIVNAEAKESASKGETVTVCFNTANSVEQVALTDAQGNTVQLSSLTCTVDESKLYTDDFQNAKSWTAEFAAEEEGEFSYIIEALAGEGKTAEININVAPAALIAIRVANAPEKKNYSYGEKLNLSGLVIEGIYSDGSVSQIHSGYTLSTYKADHIGNKNVTVSYNGFTDGFKINTAFDLISFIRSLFKF